MPTPPCKYCEKKGCGSYHTKCEAYQKFKEKNEEISKERKKESEIIEYRRYCL